MTEFEEWFNSQEDYHILSERFYCDLDLFAFYYSSGQDQKAKEFKSDIKQWLIAAFEAGVKSEKKIKQNNKG